MADVIDFIAKFAEAILAVLVIGIPLGWAAWQWFRGDLLNWVHVSISDIETLDEDKKRLSVRTLRNVHLRDLLMRNPLAGFKVIRAAKKARHQPSPVLEFSVDDGWKIRNLCRGFVSSLCSDVWIARSLKLPVETDWYVMFLTRELTRQGHARLGLTLIPKSVIINRRSFTGEFDAASKVDQSWVIHMRAIQADYLENRPQEEKLFKFLEVELGVFLHGQGAEPECELV